MSTFDQENIIFYLASIERNLQEFASVIPDIIPQPSLGGEILADNRDWLNCYLDHLRRLAEGE